MLTDFDPPTKAPPKIEFAPFGIASPETGRAPASPWTCSICGGKPPATSPMRGSSYCEKCRDAALNYLRGNVEAEIPVPWKITAGEWGQLRSVVTREKRLEELTRISAALRENDPEEKSPPEGGEPGNLRMPFLALHRPFSAEGVYLPDAIPGEAFGNLLEKEIQLVFARAPYAAPVAPIREFECFRCGRVSPHITCRECELLNYRDRTKKSGFLVLRKQIGPDESSGSLSFSPETLARLRETVVRFYEKAGAKLDFPGLVEPPAYAAPEALSPDKAVKVETKRTPEEVAEAVRKVLAQAEDVHQKVAKKMIPPKKYAPAPMKTSNSEPEGFEDDMDVKAEEAPPSRAKEFFRHRKAELEAAALRTGASQMVKLVAEPITALLVRHLAPEDEGAFRAKVAAFLETEVGRSVLAGLISVGLSTLPIADERVEGIARELRISSLAGIGDAVAELVMGPLRAVLSSELRGVLPMLELPPAKTASLPEGEPVDRFSFDEEEIPAPAARKPRP